MLNNQVYAILWKNIKVTNKTELLKELFIPGITALTLLFVNDNDSLGRLFMSLLVPVYIPSSLVGLSR